MGDLICLADQYVNTVNVLGAPSGAVALFVVSFNAQLVDHSCPSSVRPPAMFLSVNSSELWLPEQ